MTVCEMPDIFFWRGGGPRGPSLTQRVLYVSELSDFLWTLATTPQHEAEK